MDVCQMTYQQAMRQYENDHYNWEHSNRRYRETEPVPPSKCIASREQMLTAAPVVEQPRPQNIRQDRRQSAPRYQGGMTAGDHYSGPSQSQSGVYASHQDRIEDSIANAGDPFSGSPSRDLPPMQAPPDETRRAKQLPAPNRRALPAPTESIGIPISQRIIEGAWKE